MNRWHAGFFATLVLTTSVDRMFWRPGDQLATLQRVLWQCRRFESTFDGRREVVVVVGNRALRFLRVSPAGPVTVGLSQDRAQEWLRAEAAQREVPAFPHLLTAVPERVETVSPFWLQDRLIDPEIYRDVLGRGNARRTSYRDVTRFIARLNERCQPIARFELPSEAQFIAAAREVYDPATQGLATCSSVRSRGADVRELFGVAWQWTRSLCAEATDPAGSPCDPGTFLRKGGAPSSEEHPLQCVPEYRLPGDPTLELRETSFRLVLLNGG